MKGLPLAITTVAALLAASACRIEVGPSQAASASQLPTSRTGLRVRCPEALPVLTAGGREGIGFAAVRLLPAANGLLLVDAEGGLHERAAGRTIPLLEGGRDYALTGDTLVRLVEDRLEVFSYRSDSRPILARELPAQKHDVSVALLGKSVFLHSAFNTDALILRRSVADGAIDGALLPMERDLVRTLLSNPQRLHEDEGVLRGEGRWLLHLPAVRDPVTAIDLERGRLVELELAEGERGTVRMIEERVERDEQTCPTCIRRIEKRARREVVRLYADATVLDSVAWILRLAPPGSTDAVLMHLTLGGGGPPDIRAWRLEPLEPDVPGDPVGPDVPGDPVGVVPGAVPTAIAVRADTLIVAAGTALLLFPSPPAASGARCTLERRGAPRPSVGSRSRHSPLY